MDAGLLDRAAGVLIGTAAGDALGAGYEFTHPAPEQPIRMIGGGSFGWAPGEWTDDTAMAVAVALPARDGADIAAGPGLDQIAAGFVAWYNSGPADIGVQTATVLRARPVSAEAMLAQAKSLTGRTGGNGSLMRTAPVALRYLHDEDRCVAAAGAIGSLTHYDERAIEACQIWTAGIRHAVLSASLDGVRGYLNAAASATRQFWSPLLDEAEKGGPHDFPNNGWVVHALQTAWWAINSAPGNQLPAALELCVRAGGDTDTTAAIAGGLLGARWGASAVPAQWQALLHGYPGMDAAGLVALAHDIVANAAAEPAR